MLSVLFYNLREVKLNVSESANLTVRECIIFWEKARIPTRPIQHCVKKLIDLYSSWRTLQKNSKKQQDIFKRREKEFEDSLDNLFDIAHADAFQLIKIEEDKLFLLRQREPGRVGYLGGIDKKLSEKEEKVREKQEKEEKRREKDKISASTSSTVSYVSSSDESINELFTSDEMDDNDVSCHFPESTQSQDAAKRGSKNFITPKLVASLDRCQLSVRDSVYILHAVIEALGLNTAEFVINKSSIHRIRKNNRKKSAESIKVAFQNDIPQILTVHWDGKLLPALNVRDTKEERLPIIVSFGDREQLIGVPKLQNSSGEEQANAVWTALTHWGLENNVQILCSDTTASNTGRLNGACIRLEQKLNREMLFFPCRHHIYELVLRSAFESKIYEASKSPDIPFFKDFRKKWKCINIDSIQSGKDHVKQHFNKTEINEMLVILEKELNKQILRGDFKELIELCIMFLGVGAEKKFKIHPPGAMHQARWMARAIYSLKMFLFRSQLALSVEEESALRDISLFIATVYVIPWLRCSGAVKAPKQDLCFLKSLKSYERIDETISRAALKKFTQHLWYLSEELSVLSLFDEDVDAQVKLKIVSNLDRECLHMEKRYIPSVQETAGELFGKFYYCSYFYYSGILNLY